MHLSAILLKENGLRDYGTAQWVGGDPLCNHSGRKNHAHNADVGERNEDGNAFRNSGRYVNQGDATLRQCSCGARRIDRQLGLEATPDEYLQTMVAVFREVRRVLRDDGTCWVNMGDSYAHGPSGGGSVFDSGRNDGSVFYETDRPRGRGAFTTNQGLADKQLLMMPARLALALQADGWWLRSDIIWSKPNPMPESVTDRPTSAHEHVFLLSKSARYYYDADAVREEPTGRTDPIRAFGAVPDRNDAGHSYDLDGLKGRNLRNVWTIATAPFPEAHFATFPPALAETCIKAGTSERGCCANCGAPWVRQTSIERVPHPQPPGRGGRQTVPGSEITTPSSIFNSGLVPITTTTGWAPSCTCDLNADLEHPAPPVPCTVLDPFAGAGTSLLVADRLQRHAIGIELNAAYAAMSRARLTADAPLLVEVAD